MNKIYMKQNLKNSFKKNDYTMFTLHYQDGRNMYLISPCIRVIEMSLTY